MFAWAGTLVILYVLLLVVAVGCILAFFPLTRYPLHTLILIILGVFLPVSVWFVLPIDYVGRRDTLFVPVNVMLSLWKATYWTTFILTWLFLPLLESYYTSGYYQGWERLRDAVNKNLKFQLVMFVVLIASVIYLWLEVGLLMAHVKQLAIALSHIYALIMALWLMGHGLVAIPRRFWLSSTSINNLNNVYLHLPRLVDNLEDSKLLLKEDCLKVMVLQRYYADEFIEYRDWILDLYNRIPPELTSQTLRFITLENSQINQSEITKDFMRKLRSLFNANLNSYVAYKSEYTKSIDEAIYWEDVTQGNGQVQFRNNRRLMISPRFTYIYFYYIRPWICRGYAVILMALSVIMVESEILHSTKLSLVNFLLTKTTNSGVTQFLYCFLFFGFMIIAALDSLTQLKVFNMYHLVRSKSDVVSVCFYATYTARLTIPLSYNFLNLFVSRDSVFEDWYGKSVMLTGLFSILNNWLPRLIIIPLTLTMFNIYEKIKQRFGFSADLLLDDSEIEYSTDIEHGQATRNNLMIEAKRIVERELRRSESRDNRDNSNLLRPYSLTDAANINYERNRLEFHNSLVGRGYEEDGDMSLAFSNRDRIDGLALGDINSSSNGNGNGNGIGSLWNSLMGRIGLRRNIVIEDDNDFLDPLDDVSYDNDNVVL